LVAFFLEADGAVFRLGLPSFISSCGFGGVLSMRSAIRRVASSTSGFLATMTDDPSDELEITKAELDKASSEFESVYGAAIAEWSRLEGQLFYWFQWCNVLIKQEVQLVKSCSPLPARMLPPKSPPSSASHFLISGSALKSKFVTRL